MGPYLQDTGQAVCTVANLSAHHDPAVERYDTAKLQNYLDAETKIGDDHVVSE